MTLSHDVHLATGGERGSDALILTRQIIATPFPIGTPIRLDGAVRPTPR